MLKIGSGSDIMKMKGEREEKNINNFRILQSRTVIEKLIIN